jgi:hypothetical protein
MSVGTDASVDSHSRRLAALGRSCCRWGDRGVQTHDFAHAGFTVGELAAQAREAMKAQARYVTVEFGTADLCGRTSLAAFRRRFVAGVRAYGRVPLGGRMLVLSVEDLVAHWRAVHADPAGRRWLRTHQLPCGLGYDVSPTRLAAVARRTTELNDILDRECFLLGCVYDAGAYFRMPLTASDFAPRNYSLLSLAGERELAATEWRPAYALLESIA